MKIQIRIVLITTFALLSCGNNAIKYYAVSQNEESVGIAFGGGGAKAAAEIGALKVIEKAGVDIKYVAGSSMGAVIGGLYAAGYSASEIEKLMTTEEWLSLFDKKRLGITIEDSERTVFGLIKGDRFEKEFAKLLAKKGCVRIEDTYRKNNIRFCCTATRVVNKKYIEEINLSSGNMAKAIRASMTYPAPIVGYKPVEWEGMSLVDGGMLNNLPVDVVRRLGAQKVIAIDLESPKHNSESSHISIASLRELLGVTVALESLLGIKWLIDWLCDHSESREKHDCNYRDANVRIRPDLKCYSILNFTPILMDDMIEIGEYETKTHHWKELLKLKKE